MATKNVNGIEISEEDPSEVFEVLAKLGEGSYGSVFKALDKRDNKIVAIKDLEVENEDTTDLRKEINFLKDCHSEFIVGYKGSFEKDNHIWIVMEYCGAGSLCDLMAISEKTLKEEQIASVMKMALMGLQYLHSCKKIHRDIKSGNILLTHAGDCKLADFGVSAELTNTLNKRKTVIGTPYWMAPEVLQSAEYDGKADIWSLAITAIELAVGEPPHSNVHPMRAIFLIPTSEPPTLPDPDDWSDDFNNFLKTCLQKEPLRRPTASTLLNSHPFITKAKGKAIIADLVDECMQEIDEYREQEAKEAEEKENGNGTNRFETNISSNDGGGTIVPGKDLKNGAPSTASAAGTIDAGTVVPSGGTGDFGTGGGPDFGESGTMVYNKANEGKKAPAAYMKPMTGKKKAALVAAAQAQAGQDDDDEASDGVWTSTMMKPKPGAAAIKKETKEKKESLKASSSSGSVGDATFSSYYKTGKQLEVNEKSSLVDLRKGLITLNKAYERELTELDAFYSEKRKQLQALISAKEKEEKDKQTKKAVSKN